MILKAHKIKFLFTVILFVLAALLNANVVLAVPVLVAKANFPLNSISIEEVSSIWLGKKRSLGSLGRIRVVDFDQSNPLFQQFYKEFVGLTGKSLKIYWGKKMFAGKVFRPKQVSSVEEVIQLVTEVPGVIGYIDSSDVTDQLKIIRISK